MGKYIKVENHLGIEYISDENEMHQSGAIVVDLVEHMQNGWQFKGLYFPLYPMKTSMSRSLFTFTAVDDELYWPSCFSADGKGI